MFIEEAVIKISIQLEKNQKDLPAFDVVENLVEEEVYAYTCTALHIQHNALHTPLHTKSIVLDKSCMVTL